MADTWGLQKTDSFAGNMPEAPRQSSYPVKKCFAGYVKWGKRLLKIHQLMNELDQSVNNQDERAQVLEGTLGYVLCSTQEAAVVPPHVAFAIRPSPGYWEYVKVNANDLTVESISAANYLIIIHRKGNQLHIKVLKLEDMGRTGGCEASC